MGVEIEFGGIDAPRAARCLAEALSGSLTEISGQEFEVESDLGTFRIELDARWAHPHFVRSKLTDLPEPWREGLDVAIADVAGAIAGIVMPVEVVAPPLPWDHLDGLDPVCRALADAGALGTRHSAFSGFGMHLNIEAPSLAVDDLLAILRAYVILSPWLRRESGLATIRQVQSYIDPFPLAYARHILAPDYRPGMERLIRDHVAHNPSRNYELDMLPIFAAIDADLVHALMPEEKNAARPTYHWRLPDCRIDQPGWSPRLDWARWVAVEDLAADPELLAIEAVRFLEDGPQTELEARLARLRDGVFSPKGDGRKGDGRKGDM
ncbi:MAG: amidoligase family protein [Pseudomonadota bacterium]